MAQRWLAAGLALPLVLAFPAPPAGAQSQQKLQEIKRDIKAGEARAAELKEKAERAANEARTVSEQLVAKGAEIRNLENAMAALDAKIGELSNAAAAKTTAIRTQNQNLGLTLAGLERLSQHPPEILLLRPEEAVTTVRSASLLALALPAIRDKAGRLKADLDELAALRAEIVSAREAEARNLEARRAEQANLKDLHGQKQALYRDLSTNLERENARLAKLAREARDVETLLARLEKERPEEDRPAFSAPSFAAGTAFAKAKGVLPYPAPGRVTERFGDKIAGGTAKGVTIEARAGAPVVAPFDGQIIFAGPFRTYGLLLIIAHGDGYHSLLAGLSRIDGEVGQWVLAGEPVGALPETRVAASGGPGAAGGASLYLEFRKNGAPFNPLPWLKK
jgi:murein hydrolase activator